jgi:O-antigen ligase
MLTVVFDKDAHWFGLGWGAWGSTYLVKSGFVSSQSDYFVRFFDLGFLGLLGYLLSRILVIYYFFTKKDTNDDLKKYVGIGVICAFYIGGLTETADGYATTSWLVPLLFAITEKICVNEPKVKFVAV